MKDIDPQQKFEDMTWMQRVHLIRAVSLFPAITAMVFLRRKIGFRMMKPAWLVFLTVIMLFVSFAFHAAAKPLGFALDAYALAMLGLGLWQRWQRWHGLSRGESWHSYSPGISFLEMVPWPEFLKTHRRINRWLDPAAVALVGLIVGLSLCHLLGIWMMFSAFFLYVFEQDLYHRQLNREIDAIDALIASDVQAEVVRRFQTGHIEQQQSIEETAGIPTGLSFDLQQKIQKRAMRPVSVPDNLAAASPGRL